MSIEIYLPSKGLQGEDIPSHVIWEDAEIQSIHVSFRPPLKIKSVYNSKSHKVRDTSLIVSGVDCEGYLGLVFESSKTSALEDLASVEYALRLSNGESVRRVKEIRLFRPQIEIEKPSKKIILDPTTGFVKNRIGIRNVGKGYSIVTLSTTKDSPTKLEIPQDQREFLERFESDLHEEMSDVGKEFPQFFPLINEMFELHEKRKARILSEEELSDEELDKYKSHWRKLTNVLANNKEFMQAFLEAFLKAIIKNLELLENLRRFIKLYESLVSKNILLTNPFYLIELIGERQEIILKIVQSDNVWDKYEDIILPKIELLSSKTGNVPIYRLFEWS